MQLRNFPLKCIPCCYDLLSYHARIFEVINNIGELRIWSLDLDYLNKSFKELQIAFEICDELRCSDIYDYESPMNITFSISTTEEELEKFITDKIVDRFTRLGGSVNPRRLEMLEYSINQNLYTIKIKD